MKHICNVDKNLKKGAIISITTPTPTKEWGLNSGKCYKYFPEERRVAGTAGEGMPLGTGEAAGQLSYLSRHACTFSKNKE